MEDAIPIQFVAAGNSATVMHVDGHPESVQRLAELGLSFGRPLEVIQSGSPCIVQLEGVKLCLRYGNECSVLVRVGT